MSLSSLSPPALPTEPRVAPGQPPASTGEGLWADFAGLMALPVCVSQEAQAEGEVTEIHRQTGTASDVDGTPIQVDDFTDGRRIRERTPQQRDAQEDSLPPNPATPATSERVTPAAETTVYSEVRPDDTRPIGPPHLEDVSLAHKAQVEISQEEPRAPQLAREGLPLPSEVRSRSSHVATVTQEDVAPSANSTIVAPVREGTPLVEAEAVPVAARVSTEVKAVPTPRGAIARAGEGVPAEAQVVPVGKSPASIDTSLVDRPSMAPSTPTPERMAQPTTVRELSPPHTNAEESPTLTVRRAEGQRFDVLHPLDSLHHSTAASLGSQVKAEGNPEKYSRKPLERADEKPGLIAGSRKRTVEIAYSQSVTGFKMLNGTPPAASLSTMIRSESREVADATAMHVPHGSAAPLMTLAPEGPEMAVPSRASNVQAMMEQVHQQASRLMRSGGGQFDMSWGHDGQERVEVRVTLREGHWRVEFRTANSDLSRFLEREYAQTLEGRAPAGSRETQVSFQSDDSSDRRQRDEHGQPELTKGERQMLAQFLRGRRAPATPISHASVQA